MPSDPNSTAATIALISSIAALLGAFAAVVGAVVTWSGYLLSRTSVLEAARPELVLIGWEYDPHDLGAGNVMVTDVTQAGRGIELRGDFWRAWAPKKPVLNTGTIRVNGVRNVGRGVALHGVMNLEMDLPKPPVATMSTHHFSLIPPGETRELDIEITIHWKNVNPRDSVGRMAVLTLNMWALDTRGMQYEVTYQIMAPDYPSLFVGGQELAPGLFGFRRVRRRAVWWLKLDGRFKGLVSKIKASWNDAGRDLIDVSR